MVGEVRKIELEIRCDQISSHRSNGNICRLHLNEQDNSRARNTDDGSLRRLRWFLRQFRYNHALLFEGGHLTRVFATIATLFNITLFGPMIFAFNYVPQPFTGIAIYGGWVLGSMVIIGYGIRVGRYYA